MRFCRQDAAKFSHESFTLVPNGGGALDRSHICAGVHLARNLLRLWLLRTYGRFDFAQVATSMRFADERVVPGAPDLRFSRFAPLDAPIGFRENEAAKAKRRAEAEAAAAANAGKPDYFDLHP